MVGVIPTSRQPGFPQSVMNTFSFNDLTQEKTEDSKASERRGDAAHEGQKAPQEDEDGCIESDGQFLEQEG